MLTTRKQSKESANKNTVFCNSDTCLYDNKARNPELVNFGFLQDLDQKLEIPGTSLTGSYFSCTHCFQVLELTTAVQNTHRETSEFWVNAGFSSMVQPWSYASYIYGQGELNLRCCVFWCCWLVTFSSPKHLVSCIWQLITAPDVLTRSIRSAVQFPGLFVCEELELAASEVRTFSRGLFYSRISWSCEFRRLSTTLRRLKVEG